MLGEYRLTTRVLNPTHAAIGNRIPGAGKSSLADPLVVEIRRLLAEARKEAPTLHDSEQDEVIAVSLDGWHFSRAELAGFDVSTVLWGSSNLDPRKLILIHLSGSSRGSKASGTLRDGVHPSETD